MDRVNRVLNHDLFKKYMKKNGEAEANRRFCHHNMSHVMDVARIAMLLSVHEDYGLDRELVYTTCLLHDIGRHVQYAEGTPHDKVGAELAVQILADCGYEDVEIKLIIDAIRNHRNPSIADSRDLRGLLYRADKMSRACFCCEVAGECNWSDEKKNHSIIW